MLLVVPSNVRMSALRFDLWLCSIELLSPIPCTVQGRKFPVEPHGVVIRYLGVTKFAATQWSPYYLQVLVALRDAH